MKPFIKWVGGKSRSLDKIKTVFPDDYNRIIEPFVGGGAFLFSNNKPAIINDINKELINTYKVIQSNPNELMETIDIMMGFYIKNPELFFKKLRKQIHETDKIFNASRFIILNKTCFNGLYRVNKSGEFNTPWGKKDNPNIYEECNIVECSNRLKNVELNIGDFEKVINAAEFGDLVYCDPPYLPKKDNSFVSYTDKGFSVQEHIRLFDACVRAKSRGAYVFLSNSDTQKTFEIYNGCTIHNLMISVNINSDGSKRGKQKEILLEF